ncbi:MAG: serine hydrolase [Pseudomonadota bacterium]
MLFFPATRVLSSTGTLFVFVVAMAINGFAQGQDFIPTVNSKTVLVIHNPTGNVLWDRNSNQVRPIASLTKLAAALVFRAHGLKLDRGTEISRDDWKVALGGARTRLELKWTYSNHDLLCAALLASDNRAISAMGRAIGLDATALTKAMNDYVTKMGLQNTFFREPTGIDTNNLSTAWEMSQIVRQASKDPVLRKIMGKKTHIVKPLRGSISVTYLNTNPLIDSFKNARFVASKTGYNSKAGYCIAVVVEIKNIGGITLVLLGAKRKTDRTNDMYRILKWVHTTNKPSKG